LSSAASQQSDAGDIAAHRPVAADLWESVADERERLADERDLLADERDHLADEREAIADRHDQALDRRADSDSPDRAEATARLRRAEAAVQRAQADLLRAQQAVTRADARAVRRTARQQRVAAAAAARETTGEQDLAWLLDRRDFVAVERERIALHRDSEAQRRDETAAQRERLADAREREALDRERHLDDAQMQQRTAGRRQREAAAAARRTNAAARRTSADARASMAQQWGPQLYGPTLLASFADLTREVFGSDDLGGLLPRVLKFVVAAVPGCRSAAVTLWRDGRVVEAIGSDAHATELDDASAVDGPVLDVLRDGYPVHVPRIGDPPRWPRFEAAASRLGVASALQHGMFAHAPDWTPLGVLSLYGAASDAFTVEDEEFALIVAPFLSTAIAVAQRREHVERREAALHRALSSRDVIGQAKGILMERQRMSAGDAFDLLRRVSQHMNRKLSEVAEHLTQTGELPK